MNSKIIVITGGMFSGKTEELIRRIRRAVIAKQNVQVFKPRIDERYDKNHLVSHNRDRTVPAVPVKNALEILTQVDDKTEVVAIDEVQFFDNDLGLICQLLADHNINVIVAGLDTDFRGEPFGPMPQLMAIAEEVMKLHAICSVCGKDASCSQRLINGSPAPYNNPTIQVGGSETYEPRCRLHHEVPGKPVPDELTHRLTVLTK